MASTYRWRKHREYRDGLHVSKTLSSTRWSARYDAVHAVTMRFRQNITMLEEMSVDNDQPANCRNESKGFVTRFEQLESGILLEVWHTVLQQSQKISLSLQERNLSLNSAVLLLESLLGCVERQRTEFDAFQERGKLKCNNNEYKCAEIRLKKYKKQFEDGPAEDTILSQREKFKVEVFFPIIDQLSASLRYRLAAYESVCHMFGFFLRNDSICPTVKSKLRLPI